MRAKLERGKDEIVEAIRTLTTSKTKAPIENQDGDKTRYPQHEVQDA
jgi:hypothetical protein